MAPPDFFFCFFRHRQSFKRMSKIQDDLSNEPGTPVCAAERQAGQRQSPYRARSSLRVLLSSFAPSHQQPPADELQENFSPQASQIFCVGKFPTVCGPVKPALMSHRLFASRSGR
jgi:hypothetical protein